MLQGSSRVYRVERVGGGWVGGFGGYIQTGGPDEEGPAEVTKVLGRRVS